MRSLVIAALTANWLAVSPAFAYFPDAKDSKPKPPPRFEDLPEVFVPKQPRTQAELDKLQAGALFAAGRMKEQQQDYAGALRLYQRALRHDPQALTVLEAIIPLAFNLDRPTEAVRYAVKAAELDPSNPMLLRRLGIHLTEQGDYKQALAFYDKALALEKDKPKNASRVVLRLEMGRLNFLNKDYKAAAEAFAEVTDALDNPQKYGLDAKLKKDVLSEPAKLYELFGQTYLEAGDYPRATAAFEKVHSYKKDKSQLAFHLAQVHAANKEPAKALEQLQAYFDAKASGEGAEPYELLSEVLKQQGQADDFLPRLVKLQAADPANQPLGLYLADKLRTAGKLDEALPLYRKLHDSETSTESYQGLAHIYRVQKQIEPLLLLLGQLAAETDGLDSLGDESKPLLEDKALVGELLSAARKLQKADPKKFNFGLCLAAGVLASETKQFDAAGEFLDLAVKANEKKAAEVLLMWGLALLAEEKYSEAATVFQRGVDEEALPKDNPAFHFYLSGALELSGKTEEALAQARKAASMGDENPRIAARVPWVLYHAKRYPEAMAEYLKLIDTFETKRSASDVRDVLREARLVLSNICVIQKNVPQAEEWLEQVLDEYPEDISAMNDLGYLWADQNKNLPRALEMTQKAVAADPDNGAYRDSLGWALYRLGRYEEALVELKKACEDEKPDAVILDHLGDCLLALKQTKQALEAWQRAVKAFDPLHDAEPLAKTQEKIKKHS